MKITLYIIVVAVLVCGCNKPKAIPDEDMSSIIRDLTITNAYSNLYVKNLHSDTIDIYTPVLKKYGYTDKDFRYSLAKLALKKSARLTEIIDISIADIGVQDDYFTARKNVRNKIDSIAMDKYKDTVYIRDSLKLKMTSLSSASKNKITLKFPVKEGSYGVKYSYFIDSTDQNNYSVMRYNVMDSLDKVSKINTVTLRKMVKSNIKFNVETKSSDKELIVKLIDLSDFAKTPSITFDSIYVIYYEPVKLSKEKMTKEILKFNQKIPELLNVIAKKDSSTLRVVPPLRADTTSHINL